MKTTYRQGLPERDNGFMELFEEELQDDVSAGKLVDDYVTMAQEILALLLIDNEVEHLCGAYAKHDDVHEGRYQRWGSNPGSIKIQGERLPIRVPRDQERGSTETLCEATQTVTKAAGAFEQSGLLWTHAA